MNAFPLAPGEVRTLVGDGAQRDLGAALAAALPAGGVLFLEGELGAGKTTLTQGLVAALGFTDTVTSPTYALMHVYPTPGGGVLHVDAYRVRDVAELFEMDLEALVEGSRVSVIEWGEGLYAEWPDAPVLRLEHVDTSGDERRITRLR
ncbi:tRNA threonylcarbamoyladenosine biosynthesis protein TsaE [Deinococcus metalli]|uniref:tRNA threonylcarbamoyladenosine biosynthesis protein TsaE n=1 Tax=Deinococcus metalli TaxID=1141878 RepID=A0A7W8KHQ6_9DEIO|nr:tRNA (adenosine(37)-N6)-threonylcarbamoyltransferase complex ATPase subunit type 1 TsaE [Deinococcus metalli]MBB5378387.1 tRNA threonylcarbamoyladenosine biosynthesis protein TsaE [Deinococcus metalli]GHF59291.1 tRNA (adenosine(37)-N6)-threonylcarbamoyltransferase complex ATPase subunit type 1 TsaE [Deinococcus metalli]